MFDWLATTKGQWKRKSSGYHLWSSTGVSATLSSRLHCAEFVFAASAAQENRSHQISELLGGEIELASGEPFGNSKAGLSLRGVLAHGVIDVVFLCVGWSYPGILSQKQKMVITNPVTF